MLSGYIINKNIPVASFRGRIVTPIKPDLAPLCFQNGGDLVLWLESRAIDRHRSNGRALKKLLRLSDTSDLNTAIRVHGAKITDSYWVKFQAETITWENVRFSTDYFADVALKGTLDSLTRPYPPEQLSCQTPELTNIGSCEKCWRCFNGKWIMYKRGSVEERFSEVFICQLGKLLGFTMADYKDNPDGFVETPDFTGGVVNFEPMSYLVQDDEGYLRSHNTLKHFSEEAAQQYLDMLFLDAIVSNSDRHTQNYGVLREMNTGDVVGLAPNFDNNFSLIAHGYPSDPDHYYNPFCTYFADFLKNTSIRYDIPVLTKSQVHQLVTGVMPYADINREVVEKMVLRSYWQLKSQLT